MASLQEAIYLRSSCVLFYIKAPSCIARCVAARGYLFEISLRAFSLPKALNYITRCVAALLHEAICLKSHGTLFL